jgi:hypothetical protein
MLSIIDVEYCDSVLDITKILYSTHPCNEKCRHEYAWTAKWQESAKWQEKHVCLMSRCPRHATITTERYVIWI